MLDSHCHVDLLSNPIDRAREFDRMLSACVAVTYVPEHFELARKHLAAFPRVVPGLGAHPLHASRAFSQLTRFCTLAESARFIGEVGLDASREGKPSLALQKKVFAGVAAAVQPGSFVTVHSRDAWEETLQILVDHGLGPVCFHYFTAGAPAVETLAEKGHYFSVNRRMMDPAGRHIEAVGRMPRHRVLVESDAPFLGERAILQDLDAVYRLLAALWQVNLYQAIHQVRHNFAQCRTS
ncbi:MAG: TatD family hydrolase [Opitutaceae bacterium]|jgi:TatD DNase family protein|nr:TatD family hydrolase [Opitutaceae bacterium]